MKVLVVGDEHTYGYGLSGGKLSYLGHFIRQISQTGQSVSLEAYAHLTMSQLSATLAQLPLRQYDLIILQLDYALLNSWPNSAAAAPPRLSTLPYVLTSAKQPSGWWQQVKSFGTGVLSILRPSVILKGLPTLFNELRPYRHNVLLVTPLPRRERLSGWLQRRSRSAILNEADDQLFSVFDANQVIRAREEYFLPGDYEHLNAISHELLGRELFDFYQSAPTIITVQTIRREQE